MATTTVYSYKVTSINDAGNERLNVALTQVADASGAALGFNNNLNLNLTSDEAKAYWPGQIFDMTLVVSKNQPVPTPVV